MDARQPPSGRHPSFGALLRHYRQAAGLTQEELAERAGVSARNLRDLERGATRTPRRDTVALLAEALAVPAAEHAAFAAAARRHEAVTPAPAGGAAGAAPPFIGRARELALIDWHLAGQGPPVLLLAGEPGIGKSRLLQAAAARALGHGLRVLAGGCQRQGGQLPYSPLLEALQQHLQVLRPPELRAALAGCAWLVRLLPELAGGPIEPLSAWTLPPEQERRLMVEAVKRLLTNVAGPAGVLLVLDDLQWAATDALDLLATLARATPHQPLRVLGAYRDTEIQAGDPLFHTLGELAQAGLATRHHLGPLAPDEAAWLLERLAPAVPAPAARERVLAQAGGVPFFLVSWAQAVRQDLAGGEEIGSAQGDVPWTVAQGVQQRVAALPHEARELVGVASVAGRIVPRALLSQVTGRTERDLLEALEAACRARLLEEEGTHGYRFAHDVIREVVEGSLSAARRTLWHRRIAEGMEQGSGEPPVDEVAYHYLRTDDRAAAALWLERAGDRAADALAHVAAAGHYQDAARCLDALGRRADAARVREKRGDALRVRARYDEALAALEGAAETYAATGDRESLGRVTAQIGQVLGDRGTPQEGIARVQRLVQQLEEGGPSHAQALLYTTLAWLFLNTGQYPAQLAAAERAVELAAAVGDARVRARAEHWRAEALDSLRGRHESLVAFETAAALAEAVGDLYTLSLSLSLIAEGYLERDPAMAGRLAERAMAVAERHGNPVSLASALATLGQSAAATGNWAQARVSFERALALDRQVGSSFESTYCLLGIGRLCMLEGRWTEAVTYLEESAAAATRIGNLHARRAAQQSLAECDLLAERAEAARDRLLPLLDRPGLVEPAVTELLPVLTWALLDLGDLEGADSLGGQAVARARQQHQRYLLAEALRVQALVRLRQERWQEAGQILEEGLALACLPPHYPYAEARLLHVFGQIHVANGEAEAARERMGAALAIFRRLGARKDIERAEQLLATLG